MDWWGWGREQVGNMSSCLRLHVARGRRPLLAGGGGGGGGDAKCPVHVV